MSEQTEDESGRPRRLDRRLSVQTLLEHTDQLLRGGGRPGARVWPTGFGVLDSILDGGVRSGELVLLGGSEGSGKTTLAVQMARNAVAGGRHAIVFSYEHPAYTLVQRLLALEAASAAVEAGHHPVAGADVHAVRSLFEAENPEGHGLVESVRRVPYGYEALEAVSAYAARLHVFEAGADTGPDEVADAITAVTAHAGEPPLVVVDYLQKVPLQDYQGGMSSRVTLVTEAMKDISLDLECPVLCISSAERESLASGHRMRTHDLRGSSALAYEADIVMILSSKESIVAREQLLYDLGAMTRFRQWAVITIEKNRSGQGQVELEVQKDFEHGRFHPTAQFVAERLIEERVFTS